MTDRIGSSRAPAWSNSNFGSSGGGNSKPPKKSSRTNLWLLGMVGKRVVESGEICDILNNGLTRVPPLYRFAHSPRSPMPNLRWWRILKGGRIIHPQSVLQIARCQRRYRGTPAYTLLDQSSGFVCLASSHHPLLGQWGLPLKDGRARTWADLMFDESRVIVAAMQGLMRDGVPSLAVHDSLILPEQHERRGAMALMAAFGGHFRVGHIPAQHMAMRR